MGQAVLPTVKCLLPTALVGFRDIVF